MKPFVDTNVLIYAYDRSAGERHQSAAMLLRTLWQRGGGVISTQVLHEFYVNVTRKIPQPLSPVVARGLIDSYCVWQVQSTTCEGALLAADVAERHRLSFWDAAIIVAAMQGGAALLLSEDLNAGQIIEGVRVVNPFDDHDPWLRQLLADGVAEAPALPYAV